MSDAVCGWVIKKQDGRGLPCAKKPRHKFSHLDAQSIKDNNIKYRNSQIAHREASRKLAREVYGKLIREYKLKHGCERCGYRDNAYALDFDHIDPTQKTSGVSKIAHTFVVSPESTKRLWEEIEKCRVLCANCHRVWTHDRDNW